MAELLIVGDHIPVIPFKDEVGKDKFATPEQTVATCVNVGVIFELTIIVIEDVAQFPSKGVNVYVVVALLFIAGDQVPVIPFKDVVGKVFKVSPEQIAPT